MPRRDWFPEDDDEFEDEIDVLPGPASYVGGLAFQSPAQLGLSADEALRHRVRPLLVGEWAGEEEPVPPPSQVPAWAAQRGLGHALRLPATRVEPWIGWGIMGPALGQVTVEECLRGRLSSVPRGPRAMLSSQLAQAARQYVAYFARRERVAAARAGLWAREPEPVLAALSGALRRLHAELSGQPASEQPVLLGGAALAIGDDPPRAIANFTEGGYATVQLPLGGDGSQPLEPRCTCGPPRCRHARVLVEALLDAVHEGTALATELAEVLAVPSWQRLLGALARAPQAEAPRPERLVWRIGRVRGELVVQPAVQQQNARGLWSSGRKLGPDAAARRALDSAEERAALSLFGALQPLSHYCGVGATQARLLEALVGHPRLCAIEPPHEPLRLDTARATIVAEHAGEALELGVSLAGRRVPLDEVARARLDDRWGLFIEGGRATLYELPAGMTRLLQALWRYGTRLPPEAQEQAADVLMALSREVPIELPPELRGEAVASRAVFVLRLVPVGGRSLGAELLVRVAADGVEGGGALLGAEQIPGRMRSSRSPTPGSM